MASFNGRQPWIHSAAFDLTAIVGPAFFASALVAIFREYLPSNRVLNPWLWLLLVVGVDVAHVYSSLFRTYLDRSMKNRRLLWTVPAICWITGFILCSLGTGVFWTALAYLAVYHFVRQQYGFAMIYARGERDRPRWQREIDRATIYASCLYPLIYWHTHLPRNFNWFLDGDFVEVPLPFLSVAAGWLYAAILVTYLIKELAGVARSRSFNLPRNLIILGTALSWYVGIVWLNNDLAFTFTNVVSHGVPYIALIWIFGRKSENTLQVFGRSIFSMLPVFLGFLIGLAYLEEGLWDGFIWRDHTRFFPGFVLLPSIHNPFVLAFLLPLLSLPQSTHYILDAFIWRVQGPDRDWRHVLFGERKRA